MGSHVHVQVVPVPEPRISWRELSIRAGRSQPIEFCTSTARGYQKTGWYAGETFTPFRNDGNTKDISPFAFQQFLGDGG